MYQLMYLKQGTNTQWWVPDLLMLIKLTVTYQVILSKYYLWKTNVLYAGGRGFNCWLFELQALDKDCQREIEILHQETARIAYIMFLWQITRTICWRTAQQ